MTLQPKRNPTRSAALEHISELVRESKPRTMERLFTTFEQLPYQKRRLNGVKTRGYRMALKFAARQFQPKGGA